MLSYNVTSVIYKIGILQKTGDKKADAKANAGAETRFPLLTYLTLRANKRQRIAVSIERMMADMGKSKSVLTNALDWLEANGAVVKVPKNMRLEEEKPVRCVVYQLTGTLILEGEEVVYLYVPPTHKADFERALADVLPSKKSSFNELFQGVISSSDELFEGVNGSLNERERFSEQAEKVHSTSMNGSVNATPSSILLTNNITRNITSNLTLVGASACESAGENREVIEPVESVEKPGAKAAKDAGLTAEMVAPILMALLKAGAIKYDTDKDRVLGMLARFPKRMEVALELAKRIEERATNGETFTVNYFLKGFENEAIRPAETTRKQENWQRQKLGEAYRLANPTREELLRNGAILLS